MKDYRACISHLERDLFPSKPAYPFQARRETGATATAQTRGFDLANDPIMALEDDLLGLVPIAHLLCAREVGRVSAVKVLENAILVPQTSVRSLRGAILDGGQTPHGGP